MNKYTIYFEIYGKKMKASIEAYSENDAENILREEKLDIKKIQLVEGKEPERMLHDDINNDSVDFLKGMFNIK